MSESDLEKLLVAIAEKYKTGPSQNDASSSHHLIEIRHKLDTIKNDIQKTDVKLDEIKVALYEPDKGIYKRINSMHTELDDLRKKTSTLGQLENKVSDLEKTEETLRNITGKDLEHLRSFVEQKKKNDKLWIVMLTAAVTGVVKTIWDVVSSLV
jgi:DNA repair exonuclease SbcCD ATPase subunit